MPPAWDEAAGDGGRRGFNPNSAGVRDFEIPTVVSAIQLKIFQRRLCIVEAFYSPKSARVRSSRGKGKIDEHGEWCEDD